MLSRVITKTSRFQNHSRYIAGFVPRERETHPGLRCFSVLFKFFACFRKISFHLSQPLSSLITFVVISLNIFPQFYTRPLNNDPRNYSSLFLFLGENEKDTRSFVRRNKYTAYIVLHVLNFDIVHLRVAHSKATDPRTVLDRGRNNNISAILFAFRRLATWK